MTKSSSRSPSDRAAPLDEYHQKRDFARTSEPAGAEVAASAPPGDEGSADHLRFVIQKHAASSLHYDFRLELDGVLKSWAVPKGPSLDPADKRLAVVTEDHPLEYASFEGVIPEGEYGGGTVLVWDTGWWEPDLEWIASGQKNEPTDPGLALKTGELKIILHGQKLTGSWALVHMKGRGEKNWLLIKHRDASAKPGYNIAEAEPDSAVTGRSLEQVAGD